MQQIGLDATINNVPDFTAGINTMNKAVDGFASNSKAAGKDFGGGFGEIVTGALREIGTLAVDALLKAGQAVAGFVTDSIGLAGDFESGMLNFQSVAGKDVDAKGLEQFRDLFIDIGKRLPVSTSEVQQAATEMVKGGIDPATIAAGGLEQNIQFAAAAMEGDLVKAAEISSKIMGGWAGVNATAADKAEFLTHATDLLTKAANASATDVEGLSRGIFQAQGIARAAGVSFDDLTTTLAELAPRFGSSAEAGTSLKNMIARLQPTTIPAQDAMKALGLLGDEIGNRFFDATGKFIGFEQASQVLQDSLVGLNEKQRASILQTIFGNDAMSAASALSELGAQGYQNMAAALEKANGVQAAAALKQQGFNTAMDNAKGSVEALQITIGSALLPILTDLMNNVVAPAVNTFTDMASAVLGSDEAFNRLSPSMQDVVKVIGTLIDDAQNIIGAFDDAGAMSSEFGEALGLLVDDLGLPGEAIQDLVSVVQDVVEWFGKGGAASDDLGTAIDDLSGVWTLALKVVGDVMGAYQALAQAVLPIVAKFIDEHGDEISAFFKTTWNSIIQIVTLALEVYDSIVPPVLHAIAGFIEDHGAEIGKVMGGAWGAVTAIITGALETIQGVLKLALDVIHGDWDAAWKDLQGIADAQATAIEGAIGGFLDMIAGLFNTSMADIIQVWENNWNMALDIVGKIDWASAGQSVVEGIISGVRSSASQLFAALEQMAQDAYDAFMAKIKGGSPAMEFVPIGQSMVQGVAFGLEQAWPTLTAQLGGLAKGLIDQMGDVGKQVQDVIADSFGATANIDRQMAKNLETISKIDDAFTRQVVAQDLATLQKKATDLFADPKVAADYYKMVSEHEFETLNYRKQIAAASTDVEKERLNQQLILISRAQDAELDQFYARQQGQQSPAQQIATQIDDIARVLSGINLTDDQIKLVEILSTWITRLGGLPAQREAGGPVTAHTPYIVGENGPELFWPKQSGMVSPTPTAQQLQARGPTYNGQVGNSTVLNMPIYTNQSPGVLRDSMAIAGAALL